MGMHVLKEGGGQRGGLCPPLALSPALRGPEGVKPPLAGTNRFFGTCPLTMQNINISFAAVSEIFTFKVDRKRTLKNSMHA